MCVCEKQKLLQKWGINNYISKHFNGKNNPPSSKIFNRQRLEEKKMRRKYCSYPLYHQKLKKKGNTHLRKQK